MELGITERTFGLEIEYADVDKSKVFFPQGYEWDEEEFIFNTDGTKGTPSRRFGGEINTPPMRLCWKDYTTLKSVIESFRDNGAMARYGIGIDVHIYVGDLTLDELKRIYYLSYYATEQIHELCNIEPYSDQQRFRPSPTLAYLTKVKAVTTFDELKNVFVDNTKKGYARQFVNITNYFVRGTVEFRTFNTTTDFELIENCIMFAYRFVHYALTHTEDDFRKIKTMDDFVSATKVPTELPPLPKSLIYFSSIENMDDGNNLHKSVNLSSPFVRLLSDNTEKRLSCVNPKLFNLETKLVGLGKKIDAYNNDELNHILYQLASGALKIHYMGRAECIEQYNSDDPADQTACLLVFHGMSRYFSEGEFYENELESLEGKIEETMRNAIKSAIRLIESFDHINYHLGTLNDAIDAGGDIYFNYDYYSKHRTVVWNLKKLSDYDGTFERKTTHYLKATQLPDNTTLHLVSEFAYHDMNKVASIGKLIYYCSGKRNAKINHQSKADEMVTFLEPPDDLCIDDADKLKIVTVTSTVLHQAQKAYIKKVYKTMACRYGYIVMYDKYTLGGFGFDYPKNTSYDMWLLSDFSTNNNVPRIAKLILLCVQSEYVKRSMSRKLRMIARNMYTKVYTQAPVSMKYRGLFKKVGQEQGHLIYESDFGTSGTIEQIINQYKQILERAKK